MGTAAGSSSAKATARVGVATCGAGTCSPLWRPGPVRRSSNRGRPDRSWPPLAGRVGRPCSDRSGPFRVLPRRSRSRRTSSPRSDDGTDPSRSPSTTTGYRAAGDVRDGPRAGPPRGDPATSPAQRVDLSMARRPDRIVRGTDTAGSGTGDRRRQCHRCRARPSRTLAHRPGDRPVVSGAAPGRGLEALIEAARIVRESVADVRLLLWLVATSTASERYLEGTAEGRRRGAMDRDRGGSLRTPWRRAPTGDGVVHRPSGERLPGCGAARQALRFRWPPAARSS